MVSTFTVAIQELQTLLGGRLETSPSVRRHHSYDSPFHLSALPDAVAFPKSTSEVSEVARICMRHHMPMWPFGAGTAIEARISPDQGGLSIDMSLMNKVLNVSVDDMDCVVQAGVTGKQLNEYVREQGVFFSIDSAINSAVEPSIGGMVATRASGSSAVGYGTMREAVLSLTVVMADGRIIKTSSRTLKSAAGYDLTRLFVGSEGTLGIICEVALRLHAIPAAVSAAVCTFASLEGAIDTVIQALKKGIPIARADLLDAVAMSAVNRYSDKNYPLLPHLFLEFHGTEAWITEQASIVNTLAANCQGKEFIWTLNTAERNALWQARHDFVNAAYAMRPNERIFLTDVYVPISQLAKCMLETVVDNEETGFFMPMISHVGDGNFHVLSAVDASNKDEIKKAEAFHARLIERALRMGGTCTGEQGIGQGKKEYLMEELPAGVDLMKVIKRALDPDNLMNPGKVIDLI